MYLAVGAQGSSQLVAALSELGEAGIGRESGLVALAPLGCQGSAAAALEAPTSYHSVTVFFRTKAEAESFRGMLAFPPVGVLRVDYAC